MNVRFEYEPNKFYVLRSYTYGYMITNETPIEKEDSKYSVKQRTVGYPGNIEEALRMLLRTCIREADDVTDIKGIYTVLQDSMKMIRVVAEEIKKQV